MVRNKIKAKRNEKYFYQNVHFGQRQVSLETRSTVTGIEF